MQQEIFQRKRYYKTPGMKPLGTFNGTFSSLEKKKEVSESKTSLITAAETLLLKQKSNCAELVEVALDKLSDDVWKEIIKDYFEEDYSLLEEPDALVSIVEEDRSKKEIIISKLVPSLSTRELSQIVDFFKPTKFDVMFKRFS